MYLKRFNSLFFFCAGLMCLSSSAMASLVIAEGKPTGSWFNPDRSGEGFFVEVAPSSDGSARLTIAMYSFDEAGNQLWISGAAVVSSSATTATLPMDQIKGPKWGSAFNPQDIQGIDFGTLTARFTSCNSAIFQVRPNPGVGVDDYDFSTIRLTNIVGIECVDPPPTPPAGEGVEAGEWGDGGTTTCMNVAADGKSVTPVNSPCPEGASVWIDRTGLFIDANGDIGLDFCVTKTFCTGTATIGPEGNFQCISDLGLIEGFFTSKTEMYGFGYVPQGNDGGVCASEWNMGAR